MPISKDTSAGRLYNILETLRSDFIEIDNVITHDYSRIFMSALNVETLRQCPIIYAKLVKFTMELGDRVKSFKKGRRTERYARTLDAILDALSFITFENVERGYDGAIISIDLREYRNSLDDSTMANLSSMADHMSDEQLEVDVQQDDLDSIQKDILELIDSITNSGLDEHFKSRLISCLCNILSEIEKVDIFGAWHLRSKINETAGQIVLNLGSIEQTPESIELITKIWGVLTKFNAIVSFTNTVAHIAPQITPLLSNIIQT